MQTPEYVGSSAARMLSALAAFLIVVTAGVWFLTRDTDGAPPQKPEDSKSLANLVTPVAGSDATFFYKAIGQSQSAAAAAPGAKPLSYTLEIQVAASRPEAEKVIDELAAHGVEAYYTPLSRGGRVVYRIRKGVFPSHKAATAAQVALKDQHQVPTRIVKLQ